MPVLQRPFFNLTVFKVPLAELIASFSGLFAQSLRANTTQLIFPSQPYAAGQNDPPMVLWSPACAVELTAFMPHVGSGDYFVLEYACRRFGYPGVSVRSTTQEVDWPINEFVTYQGGAEQRVVRVMKDSPRWNFFQRGEPLPFEAQTPYAAKRVRDRFQREALLAYVEAWGAPVGRTEFWQSDQDAISLVRRK
jgi:hypothetical protein